MENKNKVLSITNLLVLIIMWIPIQLFSLSSGVESLNKKIADLENTVDYQSKQIELYIAISGEQKETNEKGGE